MELLLIRHAITDMAGTLCGQSDPSLNAIGRGQANSLAQLLRTCTVHRFYTSDLRRAVETALPIAQIWGIPAITRTELREICFGDWEGKRWSQVRSQRPNVLAIESAPDFSAPGGEAFVHFRNRVAGVLNEIVTECSGKPAAMVTHLGVINMILKEWDSTGHSRVVQQPVDYCAVLRVRLRLMIQ